MGETKRVGGSLETKIGPVLLTCFAPDAREAMDEALRRWREFRAGYAKAPEDEVYSFAYWLFRHSGLLSAEAEA